MINLSILRVSLLAAAALAVPGAYAATMTKADYTVSKDRINNDYKAAKTTCAVLAGNAKDICVEEANGKKNVALAEVEFSYTNTAKDQNKILVVKAESGYALAKQRCDVLAGNPKDICVKEAKATMVKALADAKVGKHDGFTKMDAADEKREADYKVAIEKCEMLAGDTKASCITAAKASAGRS